MRSSFLLLTLLVGAAVTVQAYSPLATTGTRRSTRSSPRLNSLSSDVESLASRLLQSASEVQLPALALPDQLTVSAVWSQNAARFAPALESALSNLQNADWWWRLAEDVSANPSTIPLFTAFVFVQVVYGAGSSQTIETIGSPYAAGSTTYSKELAAQFFGARPLFVLRRLLTLAKITGSLQLKLLYDWRTGQLEKNEPERAVEALSLATRCGPTTIKLAQALSLRTDLIPEGYALQLRQLQDSVPPFPSETAFAIIRQELGVEDLSTVFRSISPKPIASASIGQVYKAALLDGRQVAVKVQRPAILAEIALDLYLLRLLTPLQVRLSNAINKLETDPADIEVALQLVDEWGRGFVAEVNYELEAENTRQFSQAMQRRGLVSVIAPGVVAELSRSRIITTEWIEGTRLDRDASPDVPRLCAVAVNAYLTMLLDSGTLHCDPHPGMSWQSPGYFLVPSAVPSVRSFQPPNPTSPNLPAGNLLRTPDGKLCILDWGMTLQVPPDLQYSLLEFIAHVNSEDYDRVPGDFINLGFSPPGKLKELERSGISEGISFAFRQLRGGGGPSKIRDRIKQDLSARYGSGLTDEEIRAKARMEMVQRMEEQLKSEGIDVAGVTNVLEVMSRRNRELFKLPPYVLYVSRAFSTLEGIGLSVDSDYSILNACFPYLAQRLFEDDSPRAVQALRAMLFGTEGTLDASKMLEMVNNYRSFSSSTTTITNDQQASAAAGAAAITKILLSEKGSPIQDILAEGAARGVDSLVREGYSRAKSSALGKSIDSFVALPRALQSAVPVSLRSVSAPLFAPLLLPYHLSRSADALLRKEEEDSRVIESVGAIVNAFTTESKQVPGSIPAFSLPGSQHATSDGTTTSSSSNSNPIFSLISSLPAPSLQGLSDLSSNARKAGPIGLLIGRKVGRSLLLRAAERLDRTSSTLLDGDHDLTLRAASAASSVSKSLASRLREPERARLE